MLVRFVHMVDGFKQLKGIMRRVHNQYDSLAPPLKAWSDERSVSWDQPRILPWTSAQLNREGPRRIHTMPQARLWFVPIQAGPIHA